MSGKKHKLYIFWVSLVILLVLTSEVWHGLDFGYIITLKSTALQLKEKKQSN